MKSKEVDVCLTVTLIDGLVVARSAFHTSINYRSVVVLGKARLVLDVDEKREALRLFTNHVIAGRWEQAKQPTVAELKVDQRFGAAARRGLGESTYRATD